MNIKQLNAEIDKYMINEHEENLDTIVSTIEADLRRHDFTVQANHDSHAFIQQRRRRNTRRINHREVLEQLLQDIQRRLTNMIGEADTNKFMKEINDTRKELNRTVRYEESPENEFLVTIVIQDNNRRATLRVTQEHLDEIRNNNSENSNT